MKLHGNIQGIAPSERKRLERLYRRKEPMDGLFAPEVARSLAEISAALHRQVGLLVDRNGVVTHVIVGDAQKLFIPDLGRMRAGSGRFRGLRLLHTHLLNEGITRDDLVDLTRLRLDLVAALCVSEEGRPFRIHYAHNLPEDEGEPFATHGPFVYGQQQFNVRALIEELETRFARAAKKRPVAGKDGRAILLHACAKRDAQHADASLRELSELARTAGVEIADTFIQVRERVDPRYVLGHGKIEEVTLRAMQLDVEVLIVDRELTPTQSGALAAITELKVLDRTQLILDIFAQRASSRVGKAQVELAQMKYLLPRLGAKDDALSRLTGGIGGRGPGETKLEIGRRRARERIHRLEKELKTLAKQRFQMRKRRTRAGVPSIAIVGYTNAGKSTLLNTLTKSDVLAENKLFATLDPRSKRLRLPTDREVVISDTVGFIRNLPEELFEAFRATFETAQDADLLIEVLDASDPDLDTYIETTRRLLTQLSLDAIPRITVYNKADRLPTEQRESLATLAPTVSAKDAHTLAPLLEAIGQQLDFAPPPYEHAASHVEG